MTPAYMIVLSVLIAGIGWACYRLGHDRGKKLGRKEGEDIAYRKVVDRAKKHGYNVAKLFTELIQGE
jgi:hypothetical protein